MCLLIEDFDMGRERIFDVEEYIARATSFHEDKDRAEKLSKKVGYLNSLCESLEEKVFFRAVYEELFPEDKITIDILNRLINGAFREEKDGWLFKEIDTVEELDAFTKNLKKKIRSIIKQLQRHQLAQIDMIMRRNRERQEREEKFQRERDEKHKANEKEIVEEARLFDDLRRLSPEDRARLVKEIEENPRGVFLENDLYAIKGLSVERRRRLIGKTLEQLSPEIRRELELDRIKAKEMHKRMPQIMREVDIRRGIEKRERRRRHQPQLEPPKQLGR